MQRFFSKILCSETLKITLQEQPELYHQMTRVLRMQVGQHCIFFEENGDDFVYGIQTIDKKSIDLHLEEIRQKEENNQSRIILFQSIPNKLEKLEFLLQKGVEVGIDQFIIFEAERSQKLPILERKKDRLEQIVVEAVEQSGWNRIPTIQYISNTSSAIARAQELWITTLGVAHTDGQGKKLREMSCTKDIALFVGPEGGFSPAEVQEFTSQNALFLDFGKRILRTETAGMVAGFMLRQK